MVQFKNFSISHVTDQLPIFSFSIQLGTLSKMNSEYTLANITTTAGKSSGVHLMSHLSNTPCFLLFMLRVENQSTCDFEFLFISSTPHTNRGRIASISVANTYYTVAALENSAIREIGRIDIKMIKLSKVRFDVHKPFSTLYSFTIASFSFPKSANIENMASYFSPISSLVKHTIAFETNYNKVSVTTISFTFFVSSVKRKNRTKPESCFV